MGSANRFALDVGGGGRNEDASPSHGMRAARGAVALLLSAAWLGQGAPLEAQQTGPVAGTVRAAQSAQPLNGAQVTILGTTLGAVTDSRGRFRIEDVTGPQVTLRVQLIGYRPVERSVSVGSTDLRFSLTQRAVQLEELVVTGTPGETQARAIGNSVSNVDAADAVEKGSPQDIQGLLSGKVAGVAIQPGSGNLGTGGVTRVRGLSTLSLTNEPLIYIDGVRINNEPRSGPSIRGGQQVSRINDIPPESIESIEIIKGPAASTLYGTEASNGVIQIITKKGTEGAPQFNLRVKQGANWLMNPDERLPTNYALDPGTGELLSLDLVARAEDEGNPIFTTGHAQSFDGSLNGGFEEGFSYYMSAGFDDETGMLDYNWRKRLNGRLNLSYQVSENFNINANFSALRNETRLGQAADGWDVIGQIVWGSPNQAETATRGFLRATPEAVATIDSRARIDRFIGSMNLQHRATDWLRHRLNIGVDVGDETNSILFPRHPDGASFFFGDLSLGNKELERLKATFTTVDYAATASLDLAEDIVSETSVGGQLISKQTEITTAEGRVFPVPGVESVGGAATTFGGEDFLENKTLGVFVQERLSWKNRIFITGALRGDDNSAFGENFNFVTYPKLSGTWVVHEEPWFNVPLFNALRVRAAYGESGQQPDVFAAVRLFTPTSGPGGTSTATPSNIGNPDLEPEVGKEIEAGFDAGLLEDRLGINFTYFSRTTEDAIVQRGVAPSSGFSGSQFVNLGRVEGSGFELGLDGTVIQADRLDWQLGFTLSHNDNEVTDLGGLPPVSVGARQAHREGYPVGAFFFRRVVDAAVDSDGNVTEMLCEGGPEGGGTVACADAPDVFNGVPYPTWTSSISTTVNFLDRFQLYGLVDYEDGHHLLNGDVGAAHVLLRNSREIQKTGDKDPFLAAYDAMNMWRVAGFMDAGFAKLREISLSYMLPENWIAQFGAERARLTLSGRNLATLWQATDQIYGRPVMDPEVRLTSSEFSGYVQTVLPQMTQFFATVSVTF